MAARREQIIDAAVNCFIRKGIHQTSMNDICTESRLSIGALYVHFKSKEEIVEACWRQYLGSREEAVQKSAQAPTVREVGEQVTQHLIGRLDQPIPERDWQLWLQMLPEAVRNPGMRTILLQSWELNDVLVARLFRRGEAEGTKTIDAELQRIIARIIIAIHDGLVLQKILNPAQDISRIMKTFLQIMPTTDEIYEKSRQGRIDNGSSAKTGQ